MRFAPHGRRRHPRAPKPIVVIGVPVVTTTGVEDSALTVVWPKASRGDPSEQRLLRTWAASSGGSPVATMAWTGTVPDVAPLYVTAFWRIFDKASNAWIERESTPRVAVTVPVPAGPVQPGNVSWATTWQNPSLRQLYTATVDVAGVGRSDLLQWRVTTNRWTADWTDCPLVDADPAVTTVRSLGTILRPTTPADDSTRGGPGGPSWPVNEFYPFAEETWSIQFRKKIGAEPWTDASVKMAAPKPAGAVQPNATITVQADIRAAILDGFVETDFWVIALAGDFTSASNNPTDLSFTNLTKAGYPLIITSADRSDPANFKGYTGERMLFTRCNNFIIDRLAFRNNRTSVHSNAAATWTANSGQAIYMSDCRRFHIINCDMDALSNAVQLEHPTHGWVAYNRMTNISQDDFRVYRSSRQMVLEGNWGSDPVVNDAYAQESTGWHPDFIQWATTDLAGPRTGLFDTLVIGNRVYGFAGYKAPFFAKAERVTVANLPIDTHGICRLAFEGNFVSSGQPSTPALIGCKDVTINNHVIRRIPGAKNPQIHIHYRVENITITNTVATGAVFYASDGGDTVAALQAEVTGAPTISSTAWPATWPTAGDREAAYTTGPDHYMRA